MNKSTLLTTLLLILLLTANLTVRGQSPEQRLAGSSLTTRGNSVRYVALGSSLSGGVRDGGVNEESQRAAFPNLIAQQIGIKEFRQPLFTGEAQDGTGSIAVAEEGGILKIKPGKAAFVDDTRENAKLPKVNVDLDNWAVPYLKVTNLTVNETEPGAFLPLFEKKQYRHLDRFLNGKEGTVSYAQLVVDKIKQADLFTFEMGIHDFVSYYSSGGYGQPISFMTQHREGYFPERDIWVSLQAKGAKGVVINVPDVVKFPWYQHYTYNRLTAQRGADIYVERYGRNDVRLADPRDLFLPSEGVTGLLTGTSSEQRGTSPDNPLLDNEVIGWEEQVSVANYNQVLRTVASQNSLPVVDLFGLYEKILAGGYVTDDGVKIDPSYPTGNFFSADGVYPSAVGQGVIANEVIRTINSFYKTAIPLIKIAEIK